MTVGMQCEYQTPGQGGDELDCECESTGWDCGRQVCPAARPAIGGMCEGGDGNCTFGDEVCDCVSRMWSCWRPSDCPGSAPTEGSACTANGMSCRYGNGSCTCDDSEWDCRGIPRTDAGVRDAGTVVDASSMDAAS